MSDACTRYRTYKDGGGTRGIRMDTTRYVEMAVRSLSRCNREAGVCRQRANNFFPGSIEKKEVLQH